MAIKKLFLGFIIGVFIFLSACTKLENKETDSHVVAVSESCSVCTSPSSTIIDHLYRQLEGYTAYSDAYALGELASTEIILPTRGTTWSNNGLWRTLDQHTWDAMHPSILNSWNNLNLAAFKCQEVKWAISATPRQKVEARFLHAFFMWHTMDFWGQVPIRQITEGVNDNPKVMNRSVAHDYIMADLKYAKDSLPKIAPSATNRTPSRATANFMIARMMLNKAVYKSETLAGPYTFLSADMDAVIAAVDAITADGYTYEPNYFDIWNPDISSKEILFSTDYGDAPMQRWLMTTHTNQETKGWNGFTTLPEFYEKFDVTDSRRGFSAKKDNSVTASGIDYGFLVGQQYNKDGSKTIDTQTKQPLVFTKDITIMGAAPEKGIRVIKYHPVTSAKSDYILARYGEAVMMKIEALMRKGDNTAALTLFNELRTARKAPLLTTLTLDDVFDEWGRELYWEGHKRTTEIRFGKFTTGKGVDKKALETILYPIPASALLFNPNLKQNAGY